MLLAMNRLHLQGLPNLKPDAFTYTAVIDVSALSMYRLKILPCRRKRFVIILITILFLSLIYIFHLNTYLNQGMGKKVSYLFLLLTTHWRCRYVAT